MANLFAEVIERYVLERCNFHHRLRFRSPPKGIILIYVVKVVLMVRVRSKIDPKRKFDRYKTTDRLEKNEVKLGAKQNQDIW